MGVLCIMSSLGCGFQQPFPAEVAFEDSGASSRVRQGAKSVPPRQLLFGARARWFNSLLAPRLCARASFHSGCTDTMWAKKFRVGSPCIYGDRTAFIFFLNRRARLDV